MAINYSSVLSQIVGHGLEPRDGALEVDGRTHRCRVSGSRDKPGWYFLREITLERGDQAIVGAFGIWRGDDNGKVVVDLDLPALSDEQRKSIRKQMQEDQRRVAAERKAEAERAAVRAARVWAKCSPNGEADYLSRKQIAPHGVRFTPDGAVVVPMLDNLGKIHGLQFILSKHGHGNRISKTGRDKEFWPAGHAKRGHYHLLGNPQWICLVTEGYATAASLHEHAQYPVAVAFDANNLAPVVDNLRQRYPKVKFLICADDDRFGRCQHRDASNKRCEGKIDLWDDSPTCPTCGNEHGVKNTGRSAAANIIGDGIQWCAPRFTDQDARRAAYFDTGTKLSDYNDLHVTDGPHAVRDQIEAVLVIFGWSAPEPRRQQAEGGGEALRPIGSIEELMDRFALIYGHGGAAFDFDEHRIVKLTDVRDACTSRYAYTGWNEHPGRAIVRPEEVGFDPSETDPNVHCNLWAGWPTQPAPGCCDVHLDLLRYLCSEEDHPEQIYDWVLKWLAYPIQHPGAKMKTALIFHGPQGAGKNMLFEAVGAIYGKYALVVDQDAIEDKYNSLFSAKLFLIGDEVVARQELYHQKNKLKGFVTGDTIRINPKNVAAHSERNHVNVVFLSNEVQPLHLDDDDRRYTVVWTPPKLSPHYYVDVKEEARNGGIEALHHHLKTVDLSDFAPHTLPPMTRAKRELLDLSMDSTERFWSEYSKSRIDGIPPGPAKTEDLYALYRLWCQRVGIAKSAPMHIMSARLGKRKDCRKGQGRYMAGQTQKQATFLCPADIEQPPGKTQPTWLTDCVEAFSCAFQQYREASA